MAIDGVFLHYLYLEIKDVLIGSKINRIIQSTSLDFIFTLNNQKNNYQLLISTNLHAPRIHLTTTSFDKAIQPFHFGTILKRHLERGTIVAFEQINNDRLIKLTIEHFDELGDLKKYFLFFELMGRNTNLILTTDQSNIIESLRRFTPVGNYNSDNHACNERLIIPKAIYQYPPCNKTINPFSIEPNLIIPNLNDLIGVSMLLQNELLVTNQITPFFSGPIKPTLFVNGTKKLFYAFDLQHLFGYTRQFFPTLSTLLDHFFISENIDNQVDKKNITKKVTKELSRNQTKLINLNEDLDHALTRLDDKKKGLLIQGYLYNILKGDTVINVPDYENGDIITIQLDPLLEPLANMKKYFTSYKKALSAIGHIEKQIVLTNQEITYLDSILDSLSYASKHELPEIINELTQNKKTKPSTKKISKKIQLLTYSVNGSTIMVGKNHFQNDYLTNKIAEKNDYWFHVKEGSGAHVIIRCATLNEQLIRCGAHLASLYSSKRLSSSVAVDYTLVKYLKKVPGMKGCFVTYTNHKTIYIDPDEKTLLLLLQ